MHYHRARATAAACGVVLMYRMPKIKRYKTSINSLPVDPLTQFAILLTSQLNHFHPLSVVSDSYVAGISLTEPCDIKVAPMKKLKLIWLL